MQKRKLISIIFLSMVVAAAVASQTMAATAIADPLQIAVGARSLGMGRTYVAFAEEADTLFINPAGLGQINSAKFTSMYTTLMSDVNYIVLGGVYPLYGGSVGVGVASASLSDIQLYDGSGTSLGTGNWGENVVVASYGKTFDELLSLQNVKVGGSFKYYTSGGSGTSVEAGTGSGYDIDLGALYSPNSWLTLGGNLQNILPSSIGGTVSRQSGETDNIDSVAKLGAKIDLMGIDGALNQSDQLLSVGLDVDLTSQTGYGMSSHLGAEYWPVDALALRIGLDNDASATGTTANITAGLGIRYSGIEFNYAYHPYASISEDTTHYFSLGYVGEEIAVVAPPSVSIVSPEDKFVTNDESVKVIGIVENIKTEDLNSVSVTINGIKAPIDKTGKFEANYPLKKLGKKLLKIEVSNADGVIASGERRILRLASFIDVGRGYWAKTPIETGSTVGLIQGYPDGTFRPERALTRAELATLLVRSMNIALSPGYGKPFKDVGNNHWAIENIRAVKRAGYMAGYPDGSFKPNKKITKVEGITVMARLDKLPTFSNVETPFSDVSNKHWAAKYVNAAKQAGMLDYLKGNKLNPKANLSRAETIEMMSKTNFAGAKIKELLSWFVGFKKEGVKKETTSSSIRNMQFLLAGN